MSQTKPYHVVDLKTSMLEFEGNPSQDNEKVMPTGIKALDEPLGGGLTHESFLLVGSGTGGGKTQLAMLLGTNIAKAKFRVGLASLESYYGETQDRKTYQAYLDLYWKDPHRDKGPFDFRFINFRTGRLKPVFEKYKPQLLKQIQDEPSDLLITTKTGKFTKEILEQWAREMIVKFQCEVLLIDHLHVFDYDIEKEIRELSALMDVFEQIAKDFHVPLVLFAQFRKKGVGKSQSNFRTMDDFHGSANLTRVPSDVIIVSRGERIKNIYETYFHFPKSRFAEVKDFMAKAYYNLDKSCYDDKYSLGVFRKDNFEQLDVDQWPIWFKSHKEEKSYKHLAKKNLWEEMK